jgi:replicative DNA helicase
MENGTEQESLSEEDRLRIVAELTDPDAIGSEDEKYKYDEEFQRTMVGLLLNDRWFAVQCKDLVRPNYFVDKRHQLLCSIVFSHLEEYGVLPNRTVVVQEMKDSVSEKDDKARYQYSAEAELVYKKYVPGLESREYYLDKIVTFAKLMGFREAFESSLRLIKKDPDSDATWLEIQEILKKAILVDRNFEEGLDYFQTFDERYLRMEKDEEHREHFTSGFEMIDNALIGGGPHRGEIYSWIGLSGSGKSLALVGAALKNVQLLGKKVLYISLEMDEDSIAERFDAQISNVEINSLQQNKDIVKKAFESFMSDKEDGRVLIIKQFPAGSMTVNTLRAYMQQLYMTGFKPDLVVIDYIGEMQDYPGMPTYESRYRIVRDLRGFATEENVCIFTAMQPNKDAREAQKKDSNLGDGVIDDTNLADSYGQIRPLDGCWSINQMQAEKEAGIARLFVIKHRHGKSRFTCYAQFDMKTLQIKQISENKYNEIWKRYSFQKTSKISDVESAEAAVGVKPSKSVKFRDDSGYEDPDSPDIQPSLEQEKE